MRVCVLGPVGVTADARPEPIPSHRQRALIAALVVRAGHHVSTARLIDAVWGADPPPSARRSLYSHVSRLRAHLASVDASGRDAIVTDGNGYRLDLEVCELDAHRFESLVTRARIDLPHHPEAARWLLEEALGLWYGRPFGEVAGEGWARAEAERLEELRRTAVADRIDALLALGRQGEAIAEVTPLIAEAALAERPHGQLMVALYRAGRQTEALATYRMLAQRLRDELGLEPSDPLRGLHERILRHDLSLRSPGPATEPVDPRRSRRESSAVATTEPLLVGRDAEIAELVRLLDEVRLVTLTGVGGVGKTRLAATVAAEVADRFLDGVHLCDLAPVRSSGDVVETVIAVLDIRPSGGADALHVLIDAIGTAAPLIVLDNCEHVLDASAELVEQLLLACPHLTVLAT
jgi:DNA-binding SARP family transcriptional activator